MVTTGYSSEKEALNGLKTLLMPALTKEQPRMDRIDRWWRWNPKPIRLRQGSTWEHRMLRDLSITPWLSLVVTSVAQTLYLEGVDVPGGSDEDSSRIWAPWLSSRMSRQQTALHRSALAYGISYATVRGVDRGSGVQAGIECFSPRHAIALYEDPQTDVYPQVFMRERALSDTETQIDVWDAWNVFTWTVKSGVYSFVSSTPHLGADRDGNPVCPVIRYTNQMDLEGRTPGEVEPYIPLASRLNKDDYDRLLAQHYNSFKVRTATGLDMSQMNGSEREVEKIRLSNESILVGDTEVKYGSLPATDLSNITAAKQADVEELSAVSQTPATAFGKMVNVGDAGIEESRAGFYAKRNERRKSFGVSHMDVLRLCAAVENRLEDAKNFRLSPLWEDTDTRTLSQAVDALGKASQSLGVPQQLLWDQIPGISKTRADSWREYAREHPNPDELASRMYQSQMNAEDTDGSNEEGGGAH